MQIVKQFICLFLLFTITLNIALSQNDSIIRAKIIDSKTHKPLSEAFIIFPEINKILVSDKNGEFAFKLTPYIYNLFFTINYLAYEKLSENVSKLKINTLNTFYLKQKTIKVSKITVRPKLAKDVILRALEKIPQNYPDFPMTLYSDFSETIFYNNTVIQQYDAIMEIYKSPYNLSKKDKIQFLRAKINKYQKDNELWEYLYFVDGPYETLYADIAKYPNSFIQIPVIKVNFLKEKHFKYYSYKLFYRDDSFLIIFIPNQNNKRGVFEGKIVIDRKTYSILSLEYQYSKNRMKRVNNNPSVTERELFAEGVDISEISFKNKTVYKKYGDYYIIDCVKNEYTSVFDTGEYENPPIIKVENKMTVKNLKKSNLKEIRYSKIIKKGVKTIDQLPKNDSIP